MRLPTAIGILASTSLLLRASSASFVHHVHLFSAGTTTVRTKQASSSSSPPPSSVVMSSQKSNSGSTAISQNQNDEKGNLLYSRTPLVKSTSLSTLTHPRNVYLKFDSLQPSGSFKDRGMANLCHTLQQTKGTTKLISSSGGNAGLAVATVGRKLNMDVSVIVPQTTKALVVEKLKSLGADVTIHGANWNEADLLAREKAEADVEAEYVSPYDNPLLWTGHSTIIDEICEECPETIGAVIASVGGGGLLCGVFEGLERNGMKDTVVIPAETEGAASFGESFNKGELVRLQSINSVATSLGALEVTPVSLRRASEHQDRGGVVKPSICTDREAVEACVKFAEDHRVLVEPACGAALAVVYSDRLRKEVLDGMKEEGAIVVEVCGGSGVNLDLLDMWRKELL